MRYSDLHKRVVRKHMIKTAGEVRHIKDEATAEGGISNTWAFRGFGPDSRSIAEFLDFQFDPKKVEPLIKLLQTLTQSLGLVMVGYENFVKMNSSSVSPDGNLGGKGYIMKITDIRKQLMNVIEALSSMSDTLFDEVNAPHWGLHDPNSENSELLDTVDGIKIIRDDPMSWAEKELAAIDLTEKVPVFPPPVEGGNLFAPEVEDQNLEEQFLESSTFDITPVSGDSDSTEINFSQKNSVSRVAHTYRRKSAYEYK